MTLSECEKGYRRWIAPQRKATEMKTVEEWLALYDRSPRLGTRDLIERIISDTLNHAATLVLRGPRNRILLAKTLRAEAARLSKSPTRSGR